MDGLSYVESILHVTNQGEYFQLFIEADKSYVKGNILNV